jgi:DNA repair protein RadC
LLSRHTIKSDANATIIYHNHPSKNLQLVETDIKLTKKVKEASIFMDVQLLDHFVIIPEGKYYIKTDEEII